MQNDTTDVSNAEELRAVLSAPSSARTIRLAPGKYRIDEPIKLNSPEHTGLTICASKPENPPLIHSLQHVSGWTVASVNGHEVWSTSLPELADAGIQIRSLFVEGRPCPRARFPKFHPKEAPDQTFHARPYEEGKVPPLHHGTNRIPTEPGDISEKWIGLADAELVGLHFWTEERLPDLQFDPTTQTLSSSKRTVYRLTEGTKPLPFRYYIENLIDALTEPGEWCYRASNSTLYYYPRSGESPKETVIEFPRLHRLLEITGQGYGQSKQASEVNEPKTIEKITLTGLRFHGADWIPHSGVNLGVDHNLPQNSKPMGASVQGAFDACSTIYLEHAAQVTIQDCSFSHLGSHAIKIGEGCRDISIRHNHFEELGGSALIAHGSELDGCPANQTKKVHFTDNVCEGLGRTFLSSCGVLGGAVREMTISHNVIRDLFYSGISLGWSWGYADTISQNHLVEFNLIEDVSQGLLNDLGGIYFVGQNTGSIIRRNIVRRVKTANFGGRGIYLDEGCAHVLIEQNIVQDIGDSGFNMHYGHGHIILHNMFINSGDVGIRCSRADGRDIYNAYQNIILGSEYAFGAGYALGNLCESGARSDLNLIWPGDAQSQELFHPPYLGGNSSFISWQEGGNDRNSKFEDPGITDLDNGNYRLSTNSPAHALGFIEWDTSAIGPRHRDLRNDDSSLINEQPSEF